MILDDEGQLILSDQQIVEYQWSTHTIVLQPEAKLDVRVPKGRSLVHGVPFSVVVDGQLCYEGVVTTSYSSCSQSCPIIDLHPIEGKAGTVRIELGYPSREFFKGEDPRGDERVRKTLQALGKLRD